MECRPGVPITRDRESCEPRAREEREGTSKNKAGHIQQVVAAEIREKRTIEDVFGAF